MVYILLLTVIVALIIAHFIRKNKVLKSTNTYLNTENENVQISRTEDSVKITFRNKTGFIDGKHYTEFAKVIRELKRQNKLKDAEDLLLRIIEALKAEAEAEGPHWFIAPWYFEQLSIIYRKQHLIEREKDILEQYLSLNNINGKGETLLEVRYRKVK